MSLENVTADDLTMSIYMALRARKMDAVAALMPLLAVKDPDRAQLILDVIEARRAVK